MKHLVVTDHVFADLTAERAAALACTAGFADFQCRTEDETLAAIGGADVILTNFAPITRRVVQAMPRGAVLVRYGVGVDNVDLAAARDHGVRVCNVPDYGIEEVADHAVAMALALARRLPRFDDAIRGNDWRINDIIGTMPSLRDTTVGVIGVGRIARAFATRMAAFGCTIIGHDPAVTPEALQPLGITWVSLDQAVVGADILSLHVPLLPETRHLMDAARISRMRAGSILVNVARGGLVEEAALATALRSGHLSGAGLDVFESEPLPSGSPLRQAPNLLLSPHAAFYSERSVRDLQRLAAEEAMRALRGEPLRCALT